MLSILANQTSLSITNKQLLIIMFRCANARRGANIDWKVYLLPLCERSSTKCSSESEDEMDLSGGTQIRISHFYVVSVRTNSISWVISVRECTKMAFK